MRNRSIQAITSVLVVLLVIIQVALPCSAAATDFNFDVEVTAEACLIVNENTGRLVYEKNATKRMYPASCTKIMSAALALEMCRDPKNTIVTVPDGVWNEFDGINISNAGLQAGEEMTMYDLVCCMLLQSANEAASTVANYYNRETFVRLMNDKAKSLGCTETHFTNPHGLFNEEHYTTAQDLYKITQWAMKVPHFMEIASMARYDLPETNRHEARTLVTTNRMQDENTGYYTDYIRGIKTGTIDESGRCFVTSAVKDDVTYVGVFLGAPFEVDTRHWGQGNSVFTNARLSFDWLYENVSMSKVVDEKTPVTEIDLKYSSQRDYLMLYTEEPAYTLLNVHAEESPVITYESDLPESIEAPVSVGQVIGSTKIYADGVYAGTVNLISTEEVKLSRVARALEFINRILTSVPAMIVYAVVLVLGGAYVYYMLVVVPRITSGKTRKRKK